MQPTPPKRIIPLISELTEILTNVQCPEIECTEVFRNTQSLKMHLIKTHGKNDSLKSELCVQGAEYYCPDSECKYYFKPEDDSDLIAVKGPKIKKRFFTKLKYLKQHYIKVHMNKSYVCSKCNKGFPTEIYEKRHSEVCGNKYICPCGCKFNSLPALQTHASRRNHVLSSIRGASQDYGSTNVKKLVRNAPILPKGTTYLYVPFPLLITTNQTTDQPSPKMVSVGTNTEVEIVPITRKRKSTRPTKYIKKKRTSRYTQTGEENLKKVRKTIETQTVAQYDVTVDSQKKNRKTSPRKRKKSMETQTKTEKIFEEIKTSVASMDDDDDLVSTRKDICLPQLWLNNDGKETSFKRSATAIDEDSNLETKDYFVKQEFDKGASKTCHTETQTDKLNSFLDDYFTDCETQTQFILDQFTRWTQTCDDIVLEDLDFTNNETQTAWTFCNDEEESLISNVVKSETETLI